MLSAFNSIPRFCGDEFIFLGGILGGNTDLLFILLLESIAIFIFVYTCFLQVFYDTQNSDTKYCINRYHTVVASNLVLNSNSCRTYWQLLNNYIIILHKKKWSAAHSYECLDNPFRKRKKLFNRKFEMYLKTWLQEIKRWLAFIFKIINFSPVLLFMNGENDIFCNENYEKEPEGGSRLLWFYYMKTFKLHMKTLRKKIEYTFCYF